MHPTVLCVSQFALRLCAFGQMHKVVGRDYIPVKPRRLLGGNSKVDTGTIDSLQTISHSCASGTI